MKPEKDNVIRGFGERLALDRQIRALAEAPTTFEMERRARALAEKKENIIPALVRQLNTNDARIRGGLGLLAQFLDPDQIIPALHQVAANPRQPDESRLSAVMILERFLNVEIDPSLSQLLPNPAGVARQSAEEALRLSAEEPYVFVEYAEQLLDEPPEIIRAVLDVLMTIEDPLIARLLMTICCYAPDDVTARLIAALGSMRHPLALESLRTLNHLLDADQRSLVERLTRKLQMAGVSTAPAPSMRTLWSPVDAQGQHLLWFVVHRREAEQADLLMLALHDTIGLLQAVAQPGVSLADIPPPSATGHLHHLQIADSPYRLHLLEIEPTLALTLLDIAVQTFRNIDLPMPAALVTFGHWLWGKSPDRPHHHPWPALPKPTKSADPDAFTKLFEHSAFSSWVWDISDYSHLIKGVDRERALVQGSPVHQEIARRLLTTDVAPLLAQRCLMQARWLTLAGETATANLALAAAQACREEDLSHPFIQHLAWRSLLTAAADHAARKTLRLLT